MIRPRSGLRSTPTPSSRSWRHRERTQEGDDRRRGRDRRDLRGGARAARLRGHRPRRHQGGSPAGQGARHQPDGRRARLRGERLRDERLCRAAGSDVVVVTAGLPRQPGMSRDDLVTTNEKIVKSVTEQVVATSPDAVIVVLSNPLDAMCHVAQRVSGFPSNRVVGQAGILDTARFKAFIAMETGASIKDVSALVLGGHGDQMVAVVSATSVGGVPLRKLVSEERIQAMVQRTAVGGGELVKLLGTSAWYAP